MTRTARGDGHAIARLDLDTLLPYLDLHLVGATNGVRLFEAARTAWAGTPYEEDFARLSGEISEERAFLERLIRALGHRPSRVKMALAHGASVLARFDPLNPARRTATGGAQLELEALQSLVRGKEALWASLIALLPEITDTPPNGFVDRADLERLLDASRNQQETVARVMTGTARIRFLRG